MYNGIDPFSGVLHLIVKFPLPAVAVACTLGVGSAFGYINGTTTECEIVCDDRIFVSFTFDDARSGVYDHALEIFDANDALASIYVTTDPIGEPGYMDWQQLADVAQIGWALGGHTINHQYLTEMDDIWDELTVPIELIAENTGYNATVFASPYGAYNDQTMYSIEQNYDGHLLAYSYNNVNHLVASDPYYIRRIELTHDVDVEAICNDIETADTQDWFVFMLHQVVDENPQPYEILNTDLQAIVECANQYSEIVRVEEVVEWRKGL